MGYKILNNKSIRFIDRKERINWHNGCSEGKGEENV